ncbi:MAG TPA: hypothetical protein VGI88_00165 [Verrucomicrobiae bacterium]|jgi:hypothetical protein
MKKFWAVIVIAAIVAGLLLLLRSKHSSPSNPPQPEKIAESNFNPQAASKSPNVLPSNGVSVIAAASNEIASRAASSNPPPVLTASTNEEPILPPLTVLDKARVVIHNYRSAFGQNPVGTNPEITAALMGKNPKQINFVADSGLRVNEKGEMVDAYGTPFFFHQISGQEMEIRSAGQDRVMWTYDDLVTK